MKQIITALLFSCMFLAGRAQTGANALSANIELQAQNRTGFMMAALKTDKNKRETLLNINRQQLAALASLPVAKADPAARKRQVLQIDSVWKEGLAGVLTKKQFQQYFSDEDNTRLKMKKTSDSLRAIKPR